LEIDMSKLKIEFRWRCWAEKTRGVEVVEVDARHPARRYASLAPDSDFRYDRPDGARYAAEKTMRIIAFMDATDLRPCRSTLPVFGYGHNPPGFDHTSLWRTEDKRYVITTEPYYGVPASMAAWLQQHEWAYEVLPDGIGMWNPPSTTLVLVTPGPIEVSEGWRTRTLRPKGAPVADLAEALLRAC
jgi:hypothetical protein